MSSVVRKQVSANARKHASDQLRRCIKLEQDKRAARAYVRRARLNRPTGLHQEFNKHCAKPHRENSHMYTASQRVGADGRAASKFSDGWRLTERCHASQA